MKYIYYTIYSLHLLLKLLVWDIYCIGRFIIKVLWNLRVPNGLFFVRYANHIGGRHVYQPVRQYIDNPNKYIFFYIKLIFKDGLSEDSLYKRFKGLTWLVLDTKKLEWFKDKFLKEKK